MSFNFRHTNEDHSCPINWAIGVPHVVTLETVATSHAPRSLSPQELVSLVHELGQEGCLNPQQVRILNLLPELALPHAAE